MTCFTFRSFVAPIIAFALDNLPSIRTVATAGVLALALVGCAQDIKGDCTEAVGTGPFPELKNTCLDADTGAIDSDETGDSDSVPDTDTETGDSDSAETGETGDDTAAPIDADGDGFTAGDDCDDANAAVHPGATEICDGKDNDCDGTTDVGAADESTFYADADGDGYGDATVTANGCSAPAGFVDDATDCDDTAADIHPGATETDCAGTVDYNCDGSVGSDDADADGYLACEDCDDSEAAANPSGTEVCDGLDNDCEGTVDVSAADEATWYADSDGDSYGNPDSTTSACDEPSGYVADSTDCNDAAATAHPGGTEVCDSSDVDENCDGIAEASDSSGATIWHEDGDSDGYGSEVSVTQCDAPSGYITTADIDCDDADPGVNPGATEACNGIDDDCDDDIDESGATGESTWYSDADLDGYGDLGVSQDACEQPSKYVANSDDCDDTSDSTYPGAPETCDGSDNDCDGSADNDAVDALTWYADTDADGYGDRSVTAEDCSAPAGYVSNSTDCDDGDSGANPGEAEVCDDVDNDCDGAIDEGLGATYYLDVDSDGYGDATMSASGCAGVPVGYVANSTDCDDGDSGVSPGEPEVCDGVDNNCDGSADEGVTSVFYADSDGDGFGDPDVSEDACSASSGYVSDDTDCDDDRDFVSPAEMQECYSGLDEDCDGDVAFDDSDCGSATSENLFTTGGSWNGETSPGVASTGNWLRVSGSAVGTNCTSANTDTCSLSLAGPGSWTVTSDTAATVGSMYCMFSATSNAASTTITYSFGSSGSQSYDASSIGWGHAVLGPFSQTSAGVITFSVSVGEAETVLIDSVACQQ